ncbi:class I SAM-dependent methyltransferase family protein [Enterobacteriaceae bacterium YMB-R22]|jgi:hypothetical protein|uniref:class I SAM-dependent methyltransferase family protein n=1 Tax=Tenebrionicola larvae TaxID=2815733 RepID=UPI0020110E6B|nr:class I SAM-dependent methyltransferase family protein [Tenebrionicola larvae]MBV4411280.1 class I SAM-dependent methyltransferase family protein [Tenebrionicola larvae]
MLTNKKKSFFIEDDGFEKSYIQLDNSSVGKYPSTRAVIIFYHEDELDTAPSDFVEQLGLSGYRVFLLNWSIEEFKKNNKKASWITWQGYIFQEFIEHVNKVYGIETQDISIISFAESSLVIAAWVIDYANEVSSVVLVSPAIYASRKESMRYGLYKLINNGKQRREREHEGLPYENKISLFDLNAWGKFNDFLLSSRRIIRDAFSYQAPTLFVFTEKETQKLSGSQREFYDNIASETKKFSIVSLSPTTSDRTENKLDFYLCIREFILDRFTKRYFPTSLFNSYLSGVTRDEYEKLRLDEVNFLKRLYWEMLKKFMHSVGRLSTGIRTGLDNGFDSGISLEYMYKNTPDGKYLLGKLLDRLYLNNSACRSLRVREKNVEKFIVLAAKRLAAEGKNIRLLDIAAGCGMYIFNILQGISQPFDHILMRDFDNANVLIGRKIIQDLKMAEKATFEQGDAFSPDDLATIPRDRTLTIVSGFYELFSDNALVLASLNGISQATEEGGYLIYTTKLWNPMAAFAARVLPSQNKGEYWVLRRRTQLEIDQLVNQAGFVKVAQRIDPLGRFSVALAKKTS